MSTSGRSPVFSLTEAQAPIPGPPGERGDMIAHPQQFRQSVQQQVGAT